MRKALLLLLSLIAGVGCEQHSTEDRAREALEKIKESIPDVEAKALEQKVTPEQVTQAQEALKAVNEYQGEVNGKLDSVTVNSIEAFQRSRGIEGDGILNVKTQRLLQEALAKK